MNSVSMVSFTSIQSYQPSSGVSGASGHHGRHMNFADMVDKMSSVIDDALEAGKLTDDQADAMKKILAQVSDLLKNNQASSSASGTTNAASGLNTDDRKKVKDLLKQVAHQFMAALQAAQESQASGQTNPADKLFGKIDTNGDGKINKSELSDFVSSLQSGSQGAGNLQNSSYHRNPQTSPYSQQGSFSFTMAMSVRQSSYSVVA